MTRRIGWRRNGCGRIGQEFQLTEQVRGGIHVRSPGAAKFGWKIWIKVWSVAFAFDDTCLRDHVSRPHHPHGFHCP